jgi:hypothetical protein
MGKKLPGRNYIDKNENYADVNIQQKIDLLTIQYQ